MRQRSVFPMAAVAVAVALLAPAAVLAQESYSVDGAHVAVFNLAGEVEVVGGRGGAVNVVVTRGGRDGGELDVQIGEVGPWQALRVMYPADRVYYGGQRWGGDTELRVRADGTWGGDGDWRDGWRDRGDRVRVSSRGSGMDAHADLRIEVPAGRQVSVYLAVGRITASNVDGRIRLDTYAGGVEARDMAGYLNIDTGSGAVRVIGMTGDLYVDTGSGAVHVADVAGDALGIDTGSGGVEADRVRVSRIGIDTGSGGIEIRRSEARDVELDTGSGSVVAELGTDIDRLLVDTGSGSVTLALPEDLGARVEIETGSGGIEVEFPVMTTRRARDELRGTIGDGDGLIEIDTGSGSVRLRRR